MSDQFLTLTTIVESSSELNADAKNDMLKSCATLSQTHIQFLCDTLQEQPELLSVLYQNLLDKRAALANGDIRQLQYVLEDEERLVEEYAKEEGGSKST